ncbi:MAG: hypothetical protein HY721_21390, partial [Planctomycetes bacterium]|nr:hypothetical protein [Planctomycetota bacterium]
MTPRADRNADGNTLRGLAALLFLVFLAAAPPLSADPTYYVQRGSSWKYLQGTQEASSPDASAWRALGFAETGWGTGAAPFGYGDGPYGTNLSQLAPPMRNNYSTLFLRKAFQVADPARVAELEVNANYDDGLVAWVNGVEVLRVNVPGAPGDPVAYDGFSSGDHEQGPFEVFDLPDPGTYLASGTNVLAVQVFNTSITSSDLTLELELYDPLGPDVRPPAVAALAPPAGAVVSALASVEVTFDEPVSGVDAADLRANGSAASSLSGSGA